MILFFKKIDLANIHLNSDLWGGVCQLHRLVFGGAMDIISTVGISL